MFSRACCSSDIPNSSGTHYLLLVSFTYFYQPEYM